MVAEAEQAMESEYDVFLVPASTRQGGVKSLALHLQREAGLRLFLSEWHLRSCRPCQSEFACAIDASIPPADGDYGSLWRLSLRDGRAARSVISSAVRVAYAKSFH